MRKILVLLSLLLMGAGRQLQAQTSSSAKPVLLKPAELPVVVIVQDMERSRPFYAEVLGQEINTNSPKYVTFKAGFSLWQADRALSAIGQETVATSGNGGFELVFESMDVDAVFARLRAAQVKLVHEIREQPWGQRVVRFYDPDGHVLEAGEPMSVVVRRFLKQGMSAEEVSKRTTLPVEEVKRLASEQ